MLAPGGASREPLGGLPRSVGLEGGDHGRQQHGLAAKGALGVVLRGRSVEGVQGTLDPEVAAFEVEVRSLGPQELAAPETHRDSEEVTYAIGHVARTTDAKSSSVLQAHRPL